jgi:hypothetical protein
MKLIKLYKGSQTVEVYESEVSAYLNDGWSKTKPKKESK